MNISIIGTGYVGLVAATCFSEMGNHVTCVDLDEKKITNLIKGIIPIYEPGLKQLVNENQDKGTLFFTTDLKKALEKSEIVFIAVGTPMGNDGRADLRHVLKVAESIGKLMQNHLVVVDKSTVPVGTAEKVKLTIQAELDTRKSNLTFDVVSNPEFLKEGTAINDFMHPDRVVIGTDDNKVMEVMKQLYSPFTLNHERFISMDIKSAEMTKYAANAMLATKISFINEMANICELLGADVNKVRLGIGSDNRIGYHFIYPGCGYGGSCFPKDVNALIHLSQEAGYDPVLLNSVEIVNHYQKTVLIRKLVSKMGPNLEGKNFCVWGLAFKPGTNDMREASSIELIKFICENGGKVNAYDPKAIEESKSYLKQYSSSITYFNDKYQALDQVDALFLVTEWKEFRSPNFNKMTKLMKNLLIFDGRNQYSADLITKFGFEYEQIGVKSNS